MRQVEEVKTLVKSFEVQKPLAVYLHHCICKMSVRYKASSWFLIFEKGDESNLTRFEALLVKPRPESGPTPEGLIYSFSGHFCNIENTHLVYEDGNWVIKPEMLRIVAQYRPAEVPSIDRAVEEVNKGGVNAVYREIRRSSRYYHFHYLGGEKPDLGNDAELVYEDGRWSIPIFALELDEDHDAIDRALG